MGHTKIVSIMLIYLFTTPGFCVGPETPSAKSRKDSFDDILRPPPPPPPHLMRVHHHSHGQPRFQRHPRQPFHQGPPAFHQERHPSPPNPVENKSMFQKLSSWLFPGNKEDSSLGSRGPPLSYRPPPVYGVPFVSPGPPIKIPSNVNPFHGSLNGNSLPQYGAPPSVGPSAIPPENIPHENYGAPSSVNINYNKHEADFSQSKNGQKKNCNPCNLFPWIPVLTYQTHQKSPPEGDQLTFNTNSVLSPSLHSNGKHNEALTNFDIPTQLTLPSERPHVAFVSPVSNMRPSPPSVFQNEPFSLSQLALENNGPLFSKPLTNSYGAPIPSDTYGSPQSGTNDGSSLAIETNKDNLDHVETNNILQISKPATSLSNISYSNSVAGNHNIRGKNRPPMMLNYDKSRNVHLLQPIPLPNLSPVPLPPLFNARPFVYNTSPYRSEQNHPPSPNTVIPNPLTKPNIQVVSSVPVAEFTSSVEYPISIVQSPLLDIDIHKLSISDDYKNIQKNIVTTTSPIKVENENNQQYDSYYAASGGNDHESEDSEQDEVIYTTTSTYTTTGPPFLPTPVIREREKEQHGNHASPSTLHRYIEYSPSLAHSTTIRPNYQDYEEISPDLFHPGDPDQLQAIDSPLLYLNPNLPHKESEPFKIGLNLPVPPHYIDNNYYSPSYSQSPTITPSEESVTPEVKNVFRFIDNRAVPGRWPPPSSVNEDGGSTKKPKRIQIIIPYTSQNRPNPSQFTPNDVISSSGWIPMTDELGTNYGRKVPTLVANQDAESGLHSSNSLTDYHVSSESKIVSSSASSFNTSLYTLQPTLTPETATHLTSLQMTTPNYDTKPSFDVMKLQKNIDDWTVQEFSKVYKKQQKASTISHLKRSKKIPDDYFTTAPSVLKTSKVLLTTINDLGSFFDNEAAGSFQHSVETDLNHPKTVSNVPNEITEEEPVTITSRPTYYASTTYPAILYYRETTTATPKTTTSHSWEKIQTSISPLTRERVYVVTPLPFEIESPRELNNKIIAIQGRRMANFTEIIKKTKAEKPNNLSFKSPRFLVRPTPGPTGSQKDRNIAIAKSKNGDSIPISGIDWLHSINNLIDTTTTESASRSLFGLASVTAYTPPAGSTVQTYAGHSKVITVTPATEEKSTIT